MNAAAFLLQGKRDLRRYVRPARGIPGQRHRRLRTLHARRYPAPRFAACEKFPDEPHGPTQRKQPRKKSHHSAQQLHFLPMLSSGVTFSDCRVRAATSRGPAGRCHPRCAVSQATGEVYAALKEVSTFHGKNKPYSRRPGPATIASQGGIPVRNCLYINRLCRARGRETLQLKSEHYRSIILSTAPHPVSAAHANRLRGIDFKAAVLPGNSEAVRLCRP